MLKINQEYNKCDLKQISSLHEQTSFAGSADIIKALSFLMDWNDSPYKQIISMFTRLWPSFSGHPLKQTREEAGVVKEPATRSNDFALFFLTAVHEPCMHQTEHSGDAVCSEWWRCIDGTNWNNNFGLSLSAGYISIDSLICFQAVFCLKYPQWLVNGLHMTLFMSFSKISRSWSIRHLISNFSKSPVQFSWSQHLSWRGRINNSQRWNSTKHSLEKTFYDHKDHECNNRKLSKKVTLIPAEKLNKTSR